tara:strand:+ start:9293 stop:10156 length:864 start_codon:yes stop_codon:yes gene_type:complete
LKIVITGASGLIGGRLSYFFKKKKIIVKKLYRKDLTEKKLKTYLHNVDVIINCIGLDKNHSKDFNQALSANFKIPCRIFKISNKLKVKYFIHLSSFHIYDPYLKKINEKSQLKIKDNYSKTKILCDRKLLHLKKDTKLIIVRPCNLFGYPVSKNIKCMKLLINNIIKNLSENKIFKVKSNVDQYRYYSSIQSFCVFINNLIQKRSTIKFNNNNFIINYSSNYNLSIKQLITIILKRVKEGKNLIEFENKKMLKGFKRSYLSFYQKKFSDLKDNYFLTEIDQLKKYFK